MPEVLSTSSLGTLEKVRITVKSCRTGKTVTTTIHGKPILKALQAIGIALGATEWQNPDEHIRKKLAINN